MRMQVQSLALLSGSRIRCCGELWWRSQMRLRSGIAVAVAVASNFSLGTSICLGCGPIKKKKKKKRKKRERERGRKTRFRFTISLSLSLSLWLSFPLSLFQVRTQWEARKKVLRTKSASTLIWRKKYLFKPLSMLFCYSSSSRQADVIPS